LAYSKEINKIWIGSIEYRYLWITKLSINNHPLPYDAVGNLSRGNALGKNDYEKEYFTYYFQL
jgi:hypothetical protein